MIELTMEYSGRKFYINPFWIESVVIVMTVIHAFGFMLIVKILLLTLWQKA